MSPDQVEAILESALEKAVLQGWKPTRKVSRRNKCCCAIGAYSVVNDPECAQSTFILMGKTLKLTSSELDAISLGFDGYLLQDHDPAFFEVGRRLAERFVK